MNLKQILIEKVKLPEDKPKRVIQKLFLVYLTVCMLTAWFFWGTTMLILQAFIPAIFPLGYVLISIGNMIYFFRTKKYHLVKNIQMSISLLLPALFQWSLGGFEASGHMLMWANVAIVGALALQRPRNVIIWIVLHLVLVFVSWLVDDYTKQFQIDILLYKPKLLLIINIMTVSTMVFGLAYYFVLNQMKTQEELEKAYGIISKNHRALSDSINYARRIQAGIMDESRKLLRDKVNFFILYKPRDMVSGDFYWTYSDNNKRLIWVCADCTGHGVPGAMMSIIGTMALNKIIKEQRILEPNLVLDKLREEIISTFGESALIGGMRDGMDCVICSLELETGLLDFAGANHKLLIIRKTPDKDEYEVKEYVTDRMHIGFMPDQEILPFSKQQVKVEQRDRIYAFTDGVVDQFGGAKNTKYTYKRLKTILQEIQQSNLNFQAEKLEEAITDWKGTRDQTDDMCMIGVEV